MTKKPVTHKSKVDRLPQHSQQQTATLAVQTSYSGPIPPAHDLKQYDEVLPGAAERILAMAEHNQKHQHAIEMASINAHRREVRRGQVCAVIVCGFAFICCIVAMILDHPNVAVILGGTTVVALVTAFIVGNNKGSK